MRAYLDFEKPVAELEARIDELRSVEMPKDGDFGEEIGRLEARASEALREVYAQLSPWQKMQVARHPQRPHCLDFVKGLIDDFTPLAGDRKFGEDEAVVCGLGRFRGAPICLIGQEKGSTTDARLKHNFGMARPEGYRKAARLMELADRFFAARAGLHRHGRRLSGHRCGGARPGRGDRALDRRLPRARRAEHRLDHRGGRLGRVRWRLPRPTAP